MYAAAAAGGHGEEDEAAAALTSNLHNTGAGPGIAGARGAGTLESLKAVYGSDSDSDGDGDEAMPGTPPKPSLGGAVPASQCVNCM